MNGKNKVEMEMQKFNNGDHVMVAKDLGEMMSHFANDCEAIVLYSCAEKYQGDNYKSYCLHIKGRGQAAWYYEHQLDLIEANRLDLLEKWEQEEKEDDEMKSDLDWIFTHGKEVLESTNGAAVSALAKHFGLTHLWGSRGEGITYYSNAMLTLTLARPFLEVGDKEGWLNYCKTIKS